MIWLITGSSRGLGGSSAEVVLFAGHQVVATARMADQLSSLVERSGEQVRAISLDVTNESLARAAVDGAIHAFGRLDVLVNNAGYGDIGSKVTIIEPGGFRTDFAGASTTLKEGLSDYDSTVGAMARFQREYNGKQPGDPDKAAAAILHIAGKTEPRLRLLLGRDAYDSVEKNDLARIEAARQWKERSYSTDFRQNETALSENRN